MTGGFGPDSKDGTMENLGLTNMIHEYDINILQDTYFNETLHWLELLSFFKIIVPDNDIPTYWFWIA